MLKMNTLIAHFKDAFFSIKTKEELIATADKMLAEHT